MNNIKYKLFLQSIETNNLAKVRQFISDGMDVNVHDSYPLHVSCQFGHIDIVKLLLDNGANINAYNNIYTPLTRSINQQHFHIVDLLIERGADIHANSNQAFITVCRYNHLNYVKQFIEKGCNVDLSQCYPLRIAAELGNKEIIEYLLPKSKARQHWADIFMAAANRGHYEIANLFLKHGVNIDILEVYGNAQSKLWLKQKKAEDLANEFEQKLEDKNAIISNKLKI